MTLVLTESEIERLVGMEDSSEAIQLIEDAYLEKSGGHAALHPRLTIQYPPEDGYFVDSALRILPGMLPNKDSAAVRIYPLSHGHHVAERGPRQLDYTMGQEVLLYYRYGQGMELAAIMADYRIMNLRTAAPTGVASRLLARRDSSRLGVIGAGRHSPWQVAAVCAALPITEVRIYSPTPERRSRVAEELDARLAPSVTSVGSAEEAVRRADVVVTVTNANKPVIQSDWLNDGVHVNVIARGEVDAATLRRADVLACSWTEQILRDTPPFEPVARLIEEGVLAQERFVDLDQILTAGSRGRTSDDDVTVFLSQGVGMWDAAFAPWVYRKAREQGLGREVQLAS